MLPLLRVECAMSRRSSIVGKSFDPGTLAYMSAAFDGVCADLGVSENARSSLEIIADRVMTLADDHRDPDALRAAVIASLATKH